MAAAVARETLTGGTVSGGETRTGLIYFPMPEKPDGVMLIVRVIDLDDEVRYIVRVPMPKA